MLPDLPFNRWTTVYRPGSSSDRVRLMSVRARGEVLESDGALIPPIEIGSFAALRPDKSDFIGSASGVFFVNTVFRAFAAAARPCSVDQSEHAVATAGIATAPDPASTHSYLAADEGVQPPGADDDRLALQPELLQEETSGPPGTRFYGVSAPALGRPPPPAAAKKLLMMYFRNWHPFFPFLHGPTFFEEVDKFYQQGQNSGRDEANSEATSSQRRKLCRAVTFQCIFNIAASGRDSFHLDAGSRIQSAAALTSLLGTIYGSHDISALQALLAAELYLTSTMSLRAASTVHGALTRILYHSGYHRCPFRFVQLSSDMYDIRKRIFWCAYVLDRHLSQALGYPVAIQDDEVDVCIPGMAELHKPVKPREQGPLSQPAAGDEVREHLPRDASGRSEAERVDGPQQTGDLAVETRDAETQSPAHHHMGSPETAGEYVLGYLVTYSRLLGASLNLFHKSIHTRVITREKVTELTYRIHTWWNSLPSTLQDEPEGSSTGANPQFAAFFTTLYHYLILLCNRPFLSLPPHTMGFRSCLQAALGASRSIVATRTRRLEVSISAWPGTLSATWMASLVIAFAGLLDLYPREKAVAYVSFFFWCHMSPHSSTRQDGRTNTEGTVI